MPSTRRALLTALATTATGVLAGCSGSASSASVDCSSQNFDHSPPEVIHSVQVNDFADDGDVHLVVRLTTDADLERLDVISVYRPDDSLAYTIPVVTENGPDGRRRRYEQTLGSPPQHRRYRVEVTDTEGSVVDAVSADLHCYRESTET